MTNDGELTLRDYATVVKRRWLLIVASTTIAAVAAYAYSTSRTDRYEAKAEVLFDFDLSAQLVDPANQGRSISDRARRLENELRFATSTLVTDAARIALADDEAAVTVSADTSADIIAFTATDPDAALAVARATAWADTFRTLRAGRTAATYTDEIVKLDALLAGLRDQLNRSGTVDSTERAGLQQQIATYETRRNSLSLFADASQDASAVLLPGELPEAPVSPKPLRTAALALVLVLVASTGLAFLLEFVDDRLRTKEDLDAVARGLASLAIIPRTVTPGRATVSFADDTALAEAFSSLRTSVRFVGLRQPLRTLQITSANQAEGKSTVAAQLAVSLAHGGTPVVLVDADLRAPRLHERFGLGSKEPGLTNVLLGEFTVDRALQPIAACPNLWVMTSGATVGNPVDYLWPTNAAEGTATLPTVLEQLTASGCTVIVDSPPVLPVADARTLARFVDGTLFVAAAGSTRARAAVRAFELLAQADARLIGTVLNLATEQLGVYGYGYGQHAPPARWRRMLPARLLPARAIRPASAPAAPASNPVGDHAGQADAVETLFAQAAAINQPPSRAARSGDDVVLDLSAGRSTPLGAADPGERVANQTNPHRKAKPRRSAPPAPPASGTSNGSSTGAKGSTPSRAMTATPDRHDQTDMLERLRRHLGVGDAPSD